MKTHRFAFVSLKIRSEAKCRNYRLGSGLSQIIQTAWIVIGAGAGGRIVPPGRWVGVQNPPFPHREAGFLRGIMLGLVR